MKKLILSLVLLPLVLVQAREINVADEGIFPGEDVTLKLNRLIESLQDEPDVTLVFPTGQYDFYPENAVETYRAIANHDNGLKRFAFPLFGLKNITVDGCGSVFMFHGRIVPFALNRVEGATLKNFSIDWSHPFHDEFTVVASGEDFVVLEADPDRYPQTIRFGRLHSVKYDWLDELVANIVWDPKTRAPIFNTLNYATSYRMHRASQVGPGRYRLELDFKHLPPPVGSVLISYGENPTSRLCPAIHLSNSKDIEIQNVTVYASGGMALIAERVEDVLVDTMRVTSTNERLIASRADATHFLGCKGMIRVENSLFEHMLDDAINVHGAYVKIIEYLGDHQFLCEISHFQQWGLTFAEPGDEVSLSSAETLQPFFQTSVIETKVLNEHRFLIALKDLPEELPDGPLSMENLSWYPDVIFRNNIVRENRARGLLITTKGKVLIEQNRISSQMHGILIEGDNNVWYESGSVEDVTIRDNTFINVGYGGSGYYPLYASPLLNQNQHIGEEAYHRNIHFLDNTVTSFNGHLVYARSVKGLVVEGNTIGFSTDYPTMNSYPSIDLHDCDAPRVVGNSATGFKEPLKIQQSEGCTESKMDRNTGFQKE